MTTGVACPVPILQFFDNRGNPLVGGSILTQVGGVNAAVYSDSALTTALPNPVPLNSRGEVSTAEGASSQMFLTPGTVYTFTASDANGNQIWVATYVNGAPADQAAIGQVLWPQTAAEIAAGITPSNYAYQEGDIRRYGAVTTASDNSTAINNALSVSNNGGAAAYIPPGTWKYTSTLTPTGGACMYGEGSSSVLAPQACDGLTFGIGAGYGTTTGVTRFFRDFQLIGSNATDSTSNGININFTAASGNKVTNVSFERLYIASFGTMAYLRGAWYCVFHKIEAYNNYYGFYFNGQNVNNDIEDCAIERGTITGTGGAWGISWQSTAGESTQSTRVVSSLIYGYDINIYAVLALETQVEHCDLSLAQSVGVSVTTISGGFWLRDCWVEMDNASAVTGVSVNDLGAANGNDIHIIGNHITNDSPYAGSTGVYVGGAQQGVTVNDNWIGGFDQGINVAASPNATIKGNRINIITSVYSATSYAINLNSLATDAEVGPNYIMPGTAQAATMTNASANIGVTNSAVFPVGSPVQFDGTENGFSASCTYFVVSSSANVIQVAAVAGGTAIEATGTAAVNVFAAPLLIQWNSFTPAGLTFFGRGAFILGLTGFTTALSILCHWTVSAKIISIVPDNSATTTGTSNATTMTGTNLPECLVPAMQQEVVAQVEDSSTWTYGLCVPAIDGSLTFYKTPGTGAFTASGDKGINSNPMSWLFT